MSWYSVPPRATLINCAPRQMPSTGLAGFHEFVEQFHLVGVAQAVAGPVRVQRLLAVALRADVRTALQDQAVEVLRIIREADAAAVHDAVAADRRESSTPSRRAT
jgi:hypothetical protein